MPVGLRATGRLPALAIARQGKAASSLWSSPAPSFFLLGAGAALLQRRQRSGRAAVCLSAVEQAAEVVAEDLRVPATDRKQYRVLKLNNGLRVLLASDPTADAAGCALTVEAGMFQDPDDRPGLAHFHEHMLFLGTEKYPSEEEYNKYLGEHGGNSNAFTSNEQTCYYFKVAAAHLDGALDRFSQFFVAPTFDPDCVEREMNAVDSESTNYSTEDGWRLLQVTKSTASPEHPFSRFDVGNLQTLGSEDPVDARKRLLSWNEENYRAGSMTLAVLGRDSLEELEKQVLPRFSDIRPGDKEKPVWDSPAWPASRMGKLVRALPLKEMRALSVSFALPSQDEQLFAKPELYISHILGHEGPGSLHDVLNQRGWVDSLSVGSSHAFDDGQLLQVSISLTPEGEANWMQVLGLLYKYIDLVREAGPQEAMFKELATLQEISFAHKEESPAPDDFTVSASLNMFKYPVKETIRGPFALDEWKPEVVKAYLEQLNSKNSMVMFASSSFADEAGSAEDPGEGWKAEKWYNAMHKEEALDDSVVDKWLAMVEPEALAELRMPEPNRFIPEDLSLRSEGKELSKAKLPTEVTPPQLLQDCKDEGFLRLWHKLDGAFETPREYVLAHFQSPAYGLGPEQVAFLRLFCQVLTDDLNTVSYDANCAGLSYGVDFSDNLSLSLVGFNDKLPELLKVVMGGIQDILAESTNGTDPERCAELLEKLETHRVLLLQDYRNVLKEDPWAICSYFGTQTLLPGSWTVWEYMAALEALDPSDPSALKEMASAVKKALEKVQVEMLVHGNVSAEEAKSMSRSLEESLASLGAGRLPEGENKRWEVLKLPSSGAVFEFDLAEANPAQENCCTTNIYQVGMVQEDDKRDSCLTVLLQIAGVSAYQKLRTEEQLGYIVQAGAWGEQHVNGLSVIVQGTRLHPKEVDERIEAWIESFGEELEAMDADEFARNVAAVVSQVTERMGRLQQETTKHWTEIFHRRYRFHRLPGMVKILEGLSKEDVLAFFGEYLAKGAPQRRKLSLRVLGTSANGQVTEASEVEGPLLHSIEDARAFHKEESGRFPAAPLGDPTAV